MEYKRKIAPADFGAQLLTKGGMLEGGGALGARWEFKTPEEAKIYRLALQDPAHKILMSSDERQEFVRRLGGDYRKPQQIASLGKPANRLTLAGGYYEAPVTFKQLVGAENSEPESWVGRNPDKAGNIGGDIIGTHVGGLSGGRNPIKGLAILPLAVLGVAILVLIGWLGRR